MSEHGRMISEQPLQALFMDRISHESGKLTPPLMEGTLHYITTILLHFTESQHFFIEEEEGLSVPTLALLYQEAFHAKTTYQRNLCLRHLGDSALFIGALFPEFFYRKGIGKDYFIGMGGAAYSALADYKYGDASVFQELAAKFPRLIQVVANVCSREFNLNAEEIFALLNRWQLSKNELLRQQLNAIGITPFETILKH